MNKVDYSQPVAHHT